MHTRAALVVVGSGAAAVALCGMTSCTRFGPSVEPSPIVDAGAEAGIEATCAGGGFSDDFDKTPLGANWKSIMGRFGTLSLDDAGALSSPQSLYAAAEIGGVATLGVALPCLRALRCRFAMRIDADPGQNVFDVFVIRGFVGGGEAYVLSMNVAGTTTDLRNDIFFQDGSCVACPEKRFGTQSLTIGQWMTITVETDFKTARLYVGADAGPAEEISPRDISSVAIDVGVIKPKTTSAGVHFDDVVCTSLLP